MEQINLAIVGCGGMGRRHLAGLAELAQSDFASVRLQAVCDLNERNADDLADEALALLGYRPRVFLSSAEMVRQMDGLVGADVTVDTGVHHRVATECLDLGLHVQCEKPLALTIRGCKQVMAAAARSGRVLSVAENFRRDPMNRLVKALLDDGAIGTPRLMVETSIGGGNRIVITPWRHHKRSGTIVLDAGVHNADILQYYLGPVREVYGEAKLFEKIRYRGSTSGPGGYYEKWAAAMPDQIEATGEDTLFAYLKFAGGATGQWLDSHAGHGQPRGERVLWGSEGSLIAPGDRNGRPVRLFRDGREISGDGILDYAPSYRLEPAAAALFGGERVAGYDFPFPVTDRKLLALEYYEFAECLRGQREPEVCGEVALRDVALVYAIIESGVAGRPVT
ncbi:MAG TPA: Gfo/Idh/MocA family oxidoreductase, partial [Chloroflexota bacterium]|nr:Gfo/Idh/MocA family oxidoreductase [Chloroflexota bacterium]